MILLSFDIEEFDMPFEYGKDISLENQIDFGTLFVNCLLQADELS